MSSPFSKTSQQGERIIHGLIYSTTCDGVVATETRIPLTRDRIITTAVELADAHGVDELSMRKLADVLGVGPMALYNHVENKDDIYDGMIDFVFGCSDTERFEGLHADVENGLRHDDLGL